MPLKLAIVLTLRKRRLLLKLPLKLATVLTPQKRLLLKLPLKLAIVLTPQKRRLLLKHVISKALKKRRLLHVPTQRKAMPKTLHLKINPHEHTIPTTRKAGVLTEEPSMHWYVLHKRSPGEVLWETGSNKSKSTYK